MADGIIPSQDTLRAILDYDPETGALSHRERPPHMFGSPALAAAWNRRHAGLSAINRYNGEGYAIVCLLGSRSRAHRVIWKLVHGEEPQAVDHLNGDTSDNRLSNLRGVSFRENCRNRKLPGNNSSGVMGVHWCNTIQKWVSRIGDGNRRRVLGTFTSLSEASEVRARAEIELGYVCRA